MRKAIRKSDRYTPGVDSLEARHLLSQLPAPIALGPPVVSIAPLPIPAPMGIDPGTVVSGPIANPPDLAVAVEVPLNIDYAMVSDHFWRHPSLAPPDHPIDLTGMDPLAGRSGADWQPSLDHLGVLSATATTSPRLVVAERVGPFDSFPVDFRVGPVTAHYGLDLTADPSMDGEFPSPDHGRPPGPPRLLGPHIAWPIGVRGTTSDESGHDASETDSSPASTPGATLLALTPAPANLATDIVSSRLPSIPGLENSVEAVVTGFALSSLIVIKVPPGLNSPGASRARLIDEVAGPLRTQLDATEVKVASLLDALRRDLLARGADLITATSSFDRASLESSLNRFLASFDDLGKAVWQPPKALPAPLLLGVVIAALEMTRRWRRKRLVWGTPDDWRHSYSTLQGLS